MMRKRQNNNANENDDNGFAEFGGYMNAKINKLANQFNCDAAALRNLNDTHNNNNNNTARTDNTHPNLLFHGISVYVNGLTNPSADEIKKIMMKYGGVYHQYLNSSTTFHIASNLPNVKQRRQFEHRHKTATNRSQTKIIIPQWIVDCVQQQKLLDYSYYLLSNTMTAGDDTTTNTNYFGQGQSNQKVQPKMMMMFAKQEQQQQQQLNNNKMLNDTSAVATVATVDDDFMFDDDDVDDGDGDGDDEEIDCEYIENCDNYERIILNNKNNDIIKSSPPSSIQNQDNKNKINNHSTQLTLLNDTNGKIDNDKEKLEKSSATSTTTSNNNKIDSNLLETYLKNSRLHLISQMAFEYKSLIRLAREEHKGPFPGRLNLIGKLTAINPLTSYIEIPDNIILHIDMDCFFVSVGLLSRPHLIGKPVAVSHSKGNQNKTSNSNQRSTLEDLTDNDPNTKQFRSDTAIGSTPEPEQNGSTNNNHIKTNNHNHNNNNFKSYAEIASCSYEAREMGVKNGMFVEHALSLCPELQLIPYDFEKYRKVGDKFYAIMLRYTVDIEAVSCDEMYVNLTELVRTLRISFIDFVKFIRNEIRRETNCNCSAGIGNNRLQARMATKSAKPNGEFYLESFEVNQYFSDIKISDLPDVGQTKAKILWSELGAKTCGDLQSITLAAIQNAVGKRTGNQLFEYCRGIDRSPLNYVQINKSVSVNLNYGIRITTADEFDGLLKLLSKEIHKRLAERHQITRSFTVKCMIRKKNAPRETPKYLGHGLCDTISRPIRLATATNDCDKIFEACKNVRARTLSSINPSDLRGISIQSYKLEESHQQHQQQRTVATNDNDTSIRNMFNKLNEKQKQQQQPLQEKQQSHKHYQNHFEKLNHIESKLIEDQRNNCNSSSSGSGSSNSTSSSNSHNSIVNNNNKSRQLSIVNSHPFIDSNSIVQHQNQNDHHQNHVQQKPCRINPLRRISNNIKPTDRNVVDPIHLLNQTVDIYKGIDMNVLNELPEDIRQEILNDRKQIESYAPIIQTTKNQQQQQQQQPQITNPVLRNNRQMVTMMTTTMNAKGQTNNKNINNNNNNNRRYKSILVPAKTSIKSSTINNELNKFNDYGKIKPQATSTSASSTSSSSASSTSTSNNFGKIHADILALIPPDILPDAREIEEQRKMLEMYNRRNVKKLDNLDDGGGGGGGGGSSKSSSVCLPSSSSASATVTSSSSSSTNYSSTADDLLNSKNIIQCNIIKKNQSSIRILPPPPPGGYAHNKMPTINISTTNHPAVQSCTITGGGSDNKHINNKRQSFASSSASSSSAAALFRRQILRKISDENLLNKDDWRQSLQSWLANTKRPQSKDIEIFIGYAIEFIRADKLNDIYKCFCHFFRIINDNEDCSCEWHRSYKIIVERFQMEMIQIYKSKLFINTNFRCTKCQ